MLKKINRLSGLRIRQREQSLDTPLFKINTFLATHENIKFGFIVSKKIDKRAVVRNETKRVLKKSVKSFIDKLISNKNIIIIAKSKIKFKEEENIRRDLESAFKKLKLLK